MRTRVAIVFCLLFSSVSTFSAHARAHRQKPAQTQSKPLREAVTAKKVKAPAPARHPPYVITPPEGYYSQIGQDSYVHEHYFWNCNQGTFVDIGAHNGMTFSNSYFFEKKGWKGICIEPIPEVFSILKSARQCICLQGCVTDFTGKGEFLRITSPAYHTEMLSGLLHKYDPKHLQRVDLEVSLFGGSYEIIEVDCYLFNDLLLLNGISHVNYLSIDTEGGEFDILKTIDFDSYQIDVISVEDNYKDSRFIPFMKEKGFECVARFHDYDLLFVNKNFTPSPKSPNSLPIADESQ